MSRQGLEDTNHGTGAQEAPGSKRRKVRSCLTCRKQTTRCEFTTSVDACHRCTVLKITCAFEPDAHANLLATNNNNAQAGSTGASQESASTAEGTPRTTNSAAGKDNDRLLVIEEALRQVLKATGLPSLESISETLATAQHEHSQSETLSAQKGTQLFKTPVDLGYITLAQSTELTSIFEMRYNHCVYTPILKSHRMTLGRPFTFTVMCALALRLKTTVPSKAKHQVAALLESHIKTAMGARPYTTDAVHALLLMSLWSSVLTPNMSENDGSAIPDGWLLLSTAIHMAQSLRLDRASDEVYTLIRQKRETTPEYEVALEKARVWYTLVAYDLAMSVGGIRPRLIHTQESQSRALIDSLACSSQDQCLAFHLDALLLVHKIYLLSPPSVATQVPEFTSAINGILQSLGGLSNIAEESAMNESNPALSMEYRMFCFYEKYCECICLSKACEALAALPFDPQVSWGHNVPGYEINGGTIAGLVIHWLERLCLLSESIVNESFPFNSNRTAYLSTAPDHMFTVLAFCTGMLIKSQMIAFQFRPEGLSRASEYDDLVARASYSLEDLVLPDSQLPRRYAQSLATMLQRWKMQKNERELAASLSLPRQAPTSGDVAMYETDSSNAGHLLTLAVASMQRERDDVVDAYPYVAYAPSLTVDASSLLDPSTWLNDHSLGQDVFLST